MLDEGPSPEDIARFGDDTAYCPSCGAEVWDQAPVCASCHAPIDDGPSGRPPIERELQRRWVVIVVVLVLVSFLIVFGIAVR